MTIVEAIQSALKAADKPLGHKEIYNKIISDRLYSFGAKDPISVVRSKIRMHCFGIDFPSASPKKLFVEAVGNKGGTKARYQIWEGKDLKIPDQTGEGDDVLVEEVLHQKHKEHINSIRDQLLDCIKSADPSFFERLVVDLLLKMGYGWDEEVSGRVTGGTGDGGIDGVVSEDKLGLEKIYVQAKRYSVNKVPSNEVRDFIGAMVINGARKGVFFTSSDFSAQGIEHASKAQNMNVTLVNGAELCDLLVQNQMGIAKIAEYPIYSIDKNFFNED